MEMSTDLHGFLTSVDALRPPHTAQTQAKRKWLVEESAVKRRLSLAAAAALAQTNGTLITLIKAQFTTTIYLEGIYYETKDFPTNLRHQARRTSNETIHGSDFLFVCDPGLRNSNGIMV